MTGQFPADVGKINMTFSDYINWLLGILCAISAFLFRSLWNDQKATDIRLNAVTQDLESKADATKLAELDRTVNRDVLHREDFHREMQAQREDFHREMQGQRDDFRREIQGQRDDFRRELEQTLGLVMRRLDRLEDMVAGRISK